MEQENRRLSFTSSWRTAAQVHDLVVSKRKTGYASVVLKREGGITWLAAIE